MSGVAPAKKTADARSAFPLTLTASTWSDVLAAAHKRAADKNGTWPTGAPKVTNGEAVQLVRAWTTARSRAAFPLWYQFAAVAYGWNPDADALDTSDRQSREWYAGDATPELWSTLALLAADADADNTSDTARLYFDDSAWNDPTFAADVRNALQGDGASAAFKIPLPACKDPKTGKPVGKPHWDAKRKRYVCDPVTVDPVAQLKKEFVVLAAAIGLLWLATRKPEPRRRRRK